MKITPLFDRVVIEPVDAEERLSKAGTQVRLRER